MSDTAQEEWINPNGSEWAEDAQFTTDTDDDEGPDYTALFDAPDYASFIKRPRTAVSKNYEGRVKSLLKTGMLYSISKGNLPDAAAIIEYGPNVAAATGILADASDTTRKFLDLITAPENPYAVAFFAVVPFFAQLFRNHEEVIRQIPEIRKMSRAQRKAARTTNAEQPPMPPRFSIKIPLIRKRIPIRFRMHFNPFAAFASQTQSPNALVVEVFSDQKLLAELEKQGIRIHMRRRES